VLELRAVLVTNASGFRIAPVDGAHSVTNTSPVKFTAQFFRQQTELNL
jgi:hypothetical protein